MSSWAREHFKRVSVFDAQAKLRDGRMFCTSHIEDAVANGGTLSTLLTVPAGDFPHCIVLPAVLGSAEFVLYEAPQVTGGTAMMIDNMKRSSAKMYPGSATLNPNILSVPSPLAEFLLPGGEKNQAMGTSLNFDMAWILNESTSYLFLLTNRSGAAARMSLSLCFFSNEEIDDR